MHGILPRPQSGDSLKLWLVLLVKGADFGLHADVTVGICQQRLDAYQNLKRTSGTIHQTSMCVHNVLRYILLFAVHLLGFHTCVCCDQSLVIIILCVYLLKLLYVNSCVVWRLYDLKPFYVVHCMCFDILGICLYGALCIRFG